MKKIPIAFTVLALGTWALGIILNPPAPTPRLISREALYLTGLLSYGFMAMAVVIAARPAWVERVFQAPLDRLYGLHRTLGFLALGLAVLHWATKPLLRPLLALLPLENAPRAPMAAVSGDGFSFEAFWAALRPFAETSAAVSTLIALALGALVFVSCLSYSKWRLLHKAFSWIFLLLTVHTLRLADPADFYTPFGWLILATAGIGCRYAVGILLRGAGRQKSVPGKISSVESTSPGLTVLQVRPERALKALPGQFAFLKSAGQEKHPFSIAGSSADGTLTFIIKALGDYTSRIVPALQVGEAVEIEGPWGDFIPDYRAENQVWIAAGVGIAPFCAWLTDAASAAHGRIRLIWCLKNRAAEPLLNRVETLAAAADVELLIFESGGVRFDPEKLFASGLPDLVAVCAGLRLAASVRTAFFKAGGKADRLKTEQFNWRR